MEIKSEILGLLTYRGVLAYVATQALGDGLWTTAQLAQSVSCNTSLMLEGMGELHATVPEIVGKQVKNKWPVGTGVASDDRVQILDLADSRRQDLLDDLKAIFEWANRGVGLRFTMSKADGAAVQRWLKQHKDWKRDQWQAALRNRFLSEGIIKSQPIHVWLARLVEYVNDPQDRFGKAMPNGVGGQVGKAIGIEQSNRAAREAAVAAAGANR